MQDVVDRVLDGRRSVDQSGVGGATLSVVAHVAMLVGILIPWATQSAPGTVPPGWSPPLPRGLPRGEVVQVGVPAPRQAGPLTKPGERSAGAAIPTTQKPNARTIGHKATPSPSGAQAAQGDGTAVVIGVVDGHDSGEWYLATIRQRIWVVWAGQIRLGDRGVPIVEFTIRRDGSLERVATVQTSGSAVLDMAAERAIRTAAPFAALPRDYEPAITIRARFQPDPGFM